MAGMNHARKERGRYSQAGYVGTYDGVEERELYIAREPAGSAQDELRDFNRAGYRSARPWNETPVPVFETEAAAVVVTRAAGVIRFNCSMFSLDICPFAPPDSAGYTRPIHPAVLCSPLLQSSQDWKDSEYLPDW